MCSKHTHTQNDASSSGSEKVKQTNRARQQEREKDSERERGNWEGRKKGLYDACVCVWVNRMCVCVSGVKKQYEMKFGEDVRARRMYIYTRS